MIIYLANAKQNYASEVPGFVLAQRAVGYAESLCSFHFLAEQGRRDFPIHPKVKDEDFHGGEHEQVVDEHGLRPQPPGG